MCLYPTLIKNKRYTKTKKNGGIVPRLYDKRIEYIPIGCQNCIECRKQKAKEWQVRLIEDIKEHKNGKFIGLTFSNESIKHLLEQEITYKADKATIKVDQDGVMTESKDEITIKIKELKGYKRDNAIATKAMRLFNERWRKKYGKALRHWAITEIGHKGTNNIHIHGIVWTDEIKAKDQYGYTLEEVQAVWQYGWILRGEVKNGKRENYVNGKTVSYMTKYVHKIDQKYKEYKPKILCSPGIGANYTKGTEWKKNIYKGEETNEAYRTSTGHKMKIPIYWRNKIYTEKQREKLWIYKLNKEERWVCGERIDISQGLESYHKMVKWYRRKNHELGYGGHANQNRKEYEEDAREIMTQTRVSKAMNEQYT